MAPAKEAPPHGVLLYYSPNILPFPFGGDGIPEEVKNNVHSLCPDHEFS